MAERRKPEWLVELERLEELRRKVGKFVELVSREFGVPPPRVFIKKGLRETCCAGFYDFVEKAIYLDDRFVDVHTTLHELAHHIQHEKLGLKVSEDDFRIPHCNRPFEAEAKAFADFYKDYYEGLWGRVVGRG